MKKLWKRIVMLILFVMFGMGALITFQGYQLYQEAINETSLQEQVERIRTKDSFLPFEELPERYFQAVVSVEDRRFFEHPGIDVISMLRALAVNLKEGAIVQGGSTITQQLAKNLYFTNERSVLRKAAEIFMALDLEAHLDKEEILELYANCIYFGDGYYSIGEAAKGYFGKEPLELNTEECMMLAGIPNAPSIYAPTQNPKLAEERMEQVRESMEECGYLEEKAGEMTSINSIYSSF